MEISRLEFFINSAIPYAWDDSESWYEFLAKIKNKVNELIERFNVEFDEKIDVEKYIDDKLEELFNQFIIDSDENISGLLDEKIESKIPEIISNINALSVNIKEFGAISNTDNDVADALKNAFDFIDELGGGTLVVDGNYKLSTPVIVENENDFAIEFTPGSTIDIRNTGELRPFIIGGKKKDVLPLSANANKNGKIINSIQAFKIKPNDVVMIHSTDLFEPSRAYYFKGEIAIVESVNGTNIKLKTPLYDSYLAETSEIWHLSAPNISIKNMSVIDDGGIGVSVKYARNLVVDNCSFNGTRTTGLELWYINNAVIERVNAHDLYYEGSGHSYGIAICSSQNITVRNCHISGGRHAITTGGQEPCRNIRIHDNVLSTLDGVLGATIGLHENSEYVYVHDNHVYGMGISMMGGSCSVYNNTLNIDETSAILITQNVDADFIEVYKNKIKSKYIGVRFMPAYNNLTLENLDISNNNIVAKSGGIFIQGRQTDLPVVNRRIKNIVMNNNIVESDDYTCLTISQVVVENVVIDGGRYICLNHQTAYCRTTYEKLIMIKNSYFETKSTNENHFVIDFFDNTNTADGVVENNMFVGSNNTSSIGSFRFLKLFKLQNNVIINGTSGPGISAPNEGVIINSNNVFEPFRKPYFGVQTQIDKITQNGCQIMYMSSAPVIGQYRRGDRVFNSTPLPGNPKSWVCTESGSPGTWVSEGVL